MLNVKSRPQKTTIFKWAALSFSVGIALSVYIIPKLIFIRIEASKVTAMRYLEKYCGKENIPLVAMSEPFIDMHPSYWFVCYKSDTQPQHEVVVRFDIWGFYLDWAHIINE